MSILSLAFAYLSITALLCPLSEAATRPAPLQDGGKLPRVYEGPGKKSDFPEWIKSMRMARENDQKKVRAKLKLKPLAFPSIYDELNLDWALLPQTKILASDRCLYDPEAQKYTVGKCLDDFEQRYGGVGRILLWPAYPNLGVDKRNQFDMLRDLPGGLEGLKGAIADFHRRGVRVCLPFNPWDNGTRSEGEALEETMAKIVVAVDADCVFADTMYGPERGLYERMRALGKVVPIEPELGYAGDDDASGGEIEMLEALHWSPFDWAYEELDSEDKEGYPFVPGVDRFKWLEPRHTPCVTLRSEKDHLDSLHFAFFNGACFNAWENIFGVWNGMKERDSEALRRIQAIYRAYPRFFRSPDWEPHSPTLQEGVFASRFPLPDGTLWALVNRQKNRERPGAQLSVPFHGQKFYDLWNGKQLEPEIKGGQAVLSFSIEAGGFGAVLALLPGSAPDAGLLQRMSALSAKKLSSFSTKWKPLPQTMLPIAPSEPKREKPQGMVHIPGTDFRFRADGLVIEQYNNVAGVQFPWESAPRISHDHVVRVAPFFFDVHLVTNEEYRAFLESSGYAPQGWNAHNFLKHWETPIAAKQPVVWVSLEDSRSYCRWAGKRLPNDWEWQLAAQGTSKRAFPWGDSWNPALAPAPDTSRSPRPLHEVGLFPSSASPYGVQELTGHVWQWTNEFHDEGNRRALLRGGSSYHPQGAEWYFRHTLLPKGTAPEANSLPNKLSEHGNYLLMAPSLDRSGRIGFRCAADALE